MRFNYDVKVREGGWRPLGRDGTSDRWENTWSVIPEKSAVDLFESVNNSIAANKTYGPPAAKWTRVESGGKAQCRAFGSSPTRRAVPGMAWCSLSLLPANKIGLR